MDGSVLCFCVDFGAVMIRYHDGKKGRGAFFPCNQPESKLFHSPQDIRVGIVLSDRLLPSWGQQMNDEWYMQLQMVIQEHAIHCRLELAHSGRSK